MEIVRRSEPTDLESQLAAFHPASFGWALTCCGFDREAAQEVLQTAYLKTIDGRARFNGHASTRTWFFGVVRHTASEWRRATWVRRLALVRFKNERPVATPRPDPERLTHEAETRELLRGWLARLPARQREVLHLVFYQELTVEEAAEVLGITAGSARTHYARGKQRLRSMLEAPEEAP